MNTETFKMLGAGAMLLSKYPINMLSGKTDVDIPIRYESAWEEERQDILERANWLCRKVIVSPKQLLKEMPSMLGEQFGGQWAIYSCSMLTAALGNISVLYPEEKAHCLERMEKVISIILTPEIRHYDTMEWKEDALATLGGEKSHMTYLSILAWAISNYKLTGGCGKFDEVFERCCEALHRRMLKKKDLNLPSFPNKPIFIPDMMFTIVALRNYGKLYDDRYEETVERWLEQATTEWIHKGTGLLVAILKNRYGGRTVRGSYAGLNCSCLTWIDEQFAKEQYERLKLSMAKEEVIFGTNVWGIKEYLRKSPEFKFDYDAGPIVKGLSPSGTAFSIGAATYFEDWEFRSQLLRTAEVAGQTVKGKNQRHYRLGEIALVGEATVLAMRTNVKR